MFKSGFPPFPGCVALNGQISNSRGLGFPSVRRVTGKASLDCGIIKGGSIRKAPGT